jgi:hypothetical protein
MCHWTMVPDSGSALGVGATKVQSSGAGAARSLRPFSPTGADDATAPDANEPLGSLQGKYAPTRLATALVPDAAGFLYVDTAKFRAAFAQDLPVRLASSHVMYISHPAEVARVIEEAAVATRTRGQ